MSVMPPRRDPVAWKYRRRAIVATVGFCMATVLICLLDHSVEASVAQIAVMSAFGLMGTTIGAYVFGAAWDDKNWMEHLRAAPDASANVSQEGVIN